MDVKDIGKLLFGHKKEKERFLSAVATFNRTASEFYKLFQVARQHLLKNQIQEAEQLTKLNNSKLNNFSLNSASKSQTSADFFYKKAVGGNDVVNTPPQANVSNSTNPRLAMQINQIISQIEESNATTRILKSDVLHLWSERRNQLQEIMKLISFETAAKNMLETIKSDDNRFLELMKILDEENWAILFKDDLSRLEETITRAIFSHRTQRKTFVKNKHSYEQLVSLSEHLTVKLGSSL